MLKRVFNKSVLFILGKFLSLLGAEDSGYSALNLLKQLVYQEEKSITTHSIPVEKQIFFLFANRMIVDTQSSRLLAEKGLYGSGYSITAVMLRSITMYASLMADKTRLEAFWNEKDNTYQIDQNFFNSFKESAVRNLAKSKFGQDSFNKSEFEKLLHGSCYAIRKYYSRKQISADGKSEPILMFGGFTQESKAKAIKSISGAVILDFLGIFFTDYQEKNRTDLTDLESYYHTIIKRVKIETAHLEKEYEKTHEKVR